MSRFSHRFWPVLAATLALLSPKPAEAQNGSLVPAGGTVSPILSLPGEHLVPAAIGVRTDQRGNSWNVEPNGTLGRIGSTMVNSGLALSVNQQKFETFQPRMTPDGEEFVIHGRPLPGLSGVDIVRRIRFAEDIGALLFLELFFNGSSTPVSLDIELATSFSGNYQSSVTDRGNIEPVRLLDNESGLIVTPGSSQANRAFLFVLGAPDALEKPTISAQSRYGLKFQYQITLQPGQTRGIAHAVAQTIVPRDFDRKTLSRLFTPFSLENFAPSIPDAFEESIVNRAPRHSRGETARTIASLGVSPADTDLLATGKETRLVGEARFADLLVATDFGDATIPAARVAAIAGEYRGLRDRTEVFLDDGQILTGRVDQEIEFVTGNGVRTTVSTRDLDRLILARKEAPELPKHAMIRLTPGDQLLLSPDFPVRLQGITPWGDLAFSTGEIRSLAGAENGHPGFRLRLVDGAECLIYLGGEDLTLDLASLGELAVPVSAVRSVVPAPGSAASPPPSRTRVRLSTGQVVPGELENETLVIFSNGQTIDLDPDSIRSLKKLTHNGTTIPAYESFLVELRDGSRIDGVLREEFLHFSVRDRPWSFPLGDVEEVAFPGPALDPQQRKAVAELISRLGNDDWSTREKATLDLSRMGNHIIPMLKKVQVQNPDPEVRRRIARILSTLTDQAL